MEIFDDLFALPEALVGNRHWSSKIQELDIPTIVVDEFYTISTWGESDDGEKQAFRKWFLYIGELRSLFPDASVLALSATCTKAISKSVSKVLNLDVSLKEVRISPNKPNIKISIHKIPNKLKWLLHGY